MIESSTTLLQDFLQNLGYDCELPAFEDREHILKWLRARKKDIFRIAKVKVYVRKLVRTKETARVSIGVLPYGTHDMLILPCDLVVFAHFL